MFNFDVKFITSEESLQLSNVDFKSFKYETKKRLDETVQDSAKRSYCESRGGNWRAPRPRQIRKLESKLRDKSIITSEWTNDSLITIVFSSGAIAYLTVKPSTLDVTQILFDRYCVGKLASTTITGVVLSSSHIMFAHADRVATLITFSKAANFSPCRISDRDPHIQTIELGGGPRRTERRLSWSQSGNRLQVLIWSTATAEPAPWSPVLEDHANLHLYDIDRQQMFLRAFHQTENETLLAELSHKHDHVVHIVEQINCHKAGVSLEWSRFDCAGATDRVTKLSALRDGDTRATLPSPARTVRRSPCDQKLLVACIDGTLHVVHSIAGITHSTRASFIATDVRWCGELIVAAEESGRLQCFDRALSALQHHAKWRDLTAYIRDGRLQILATRKTIGGSCILATFNCGPLALLRITHGRLLTAWLQAGRSSNAVSLLRAMDWDEEGTECLWAVNKLVCQALRSGPAWLAEEGAAQAALGAFLAPRGAPPAAAARFAAPVHDLARKFAHHLLRRGGAEKVLSLAVDLQAWDVCCDVRWWAARHARPELRREAAALAARYAALHAQDSDCSDSCSQCSSRSYSTSEADTNEDTTKTEPPPLPRVSLPSYPTVMPVLITPTEPTSTNSIRPNLHQYLERDNTIWNTNVKETNGYDMYKTVLTNNMKSMNINKPGSSKLMVINEVPSNTTVDIPRVHEDRLNSGHFMNMFKTELREEFPNRYRYQITDSSNSSLNALGRSDNGMERNGHKSVEKNKVKFSNTVTVAVVSEPRVCPETERELADSLPLCAPHAYLSAFAPLPAPAAPPAPPAPAPAPAAGTLDYVEV
ncbi:WD repeat-containing and planar cell polarity effector protein fritz isoform X2 [Amyelois transitella]|uniref:WD repeat-containing and planar cell polarity effector protein fritz isoform X2 n=1 Tax=Amyelois transitella TaxID=680683 RepID=UPI00067CD9F1|nr:WD repeat-containing and planar cell polarity effector protein fritz isoform X2 [Amyelois transitella]XP_013187325.1 WD repeat-containing and planar cell polarity effector protein fritz isoform X2 [Amyelois transitella]XP_060803822.1 WD repeat-containing and planar cell polarity effector protein fritz isoform X2 [Amyelois transitella]